MQIRDRIKEFKRVSAGELRPNPKNWRTHPEAQQNALRGLLAEVGYADALLVRELPDGNLEIVDGHLRAETTPHTEVPVLVLDVNEEEADKLLASVDPIGAMAGRDDAKLRALLDRLKTRSEGLKEMFAGMRDLVAERLKPDERDAPVPDPPADPITKLGDVWELGTHRLICGDSTDRTTVNELLAGDKPSLMTTDQPYGVNYDPTWREKVDGSTNHADGLVLNDHRDDWTAAYKLFAGDVAYVWHGSLSAGQVANNLAAAGFGVRSQIVWVKQQLVISRGHYHWQHEPCWYAVREGATAKWTGDRKQSTVWHVAVSIGGKNVDDMRTNHSTQKPVELFARAMRNHGRRGDVVYDPFCGSGTAIIAAEETGRHCRAIELSPGYCDVIVDRWEKLTGRKAQRKERSNGTDVTMGTGLDLPAAA